MQLGRYTSINVDFNQSFVWQTKYYLCGLASKLIVSGCFDLSFPTLLISIAVFLGEEGQDRGEAAEFDVDIEALDVASVSS